jgi:hypothetical protein
MTDPLASSGAPPVPSAARPERRALRAPATAVGLLTAVALGAGVLLLPGGSPAAGAELAAVAVVQRPAQPVLLAAPTVTPPPAPPAPDRSATRSAP